MLASPKNAGQLRAASRPPQKEQLSTSDRAAVELNELDGTGREWRYELTRAAFEAQIEDLVRSTKVQLDEALGRKRLKPVDIDTILMVGGSSRIPLVRQVVSDYFGGCPLRTDVHPDEAVALGAAVLGGIEENVATPATIVITDVAPWTLGVAVQEERLGEQVSGIFSPLIVKQSTIPCTVTKRYFTELRLATDHPTRWRSTRATHPCARKTSRSGSSSSSNWSARGGVPTSRSRSLTT